MVERPPQEWIDYWDQTIKADLKERIAKFDARWAKDELLVRNHERGYREGNLVQEFVRMLHRRLFAKPFEVSIRPDDAAYADQAEAAEIVASSVARVANLQAAYRSAGAAATWAGVGWIEVGHPLDPWSLDLMRSGRSPNLPSTAVGGPQDDYVEVAPDELSAYGVAPEQVQPLDGFNAPLPGPQAEPLPLFNPALGNCWAAPVDPRLVVVPPRLRAFDVCPYYARLRFLTTGELEQVSGVSLRASGASEYASLFEATEACALTAYPEMLLVADVWVVRDRNNPRYNNYRFSYAFGSERELIYFGPNPYGGLVNLVPVLLSETKAVYDTTPAAELAPFADIYHKGIKALGRNVARQLSRKWWKEQGAGLSPVAEQQLKNDEYSGVIEVQSANAVKLEPKENFDASLFQSLSWVRAQAQAGAGASDLDVGRAVKDITARQTQALLEATGINVEAMKATVQRSAGEAVLKLMYLTGVFSTAGRARSYYYGRQMVSFDRGTHDFTSSLVYDVEVVDAGDKMTNEELMLWLQFWRTLQQDTQGVFLPFYDREFLARVNLRRFGIGPQALASRSANREGMGTPPVGQQAEMLAVLGNSPGGTPGNNVLDFGGGAGSEAVLQEMTEGQHPERTPGSRGPGVGNAVQGLSRVGTGYGERRK